MFVITCWCSSNVWRLMCVFMFVIPLLMFIGTVDICSCSLSSDFWCVSCVFFTCWCNNDCWCVSMSVLHSRADVHVTNVDVSTFVIHMLVLLQVSICVHVWCSHVGVVTVELTVSLCSCLLVECDVRPTCDVCLCPGSTCFNCYYNSCCSYTCARLPAPRLYNYMT